MATEATIKSYFESGDKPTQAQFFELIERIFANLAKIENVENYAIADMAAYIAKSPELTDEILSTSVANQKRKFTVSDFITLLQVYVGRNETALGSISTATAPKSPAEIGDYYIASADGNYTAGNFDLTGVKAGDKLKATGASTWYNEGQVVAIGEKKIYVDKISGSDLNSGLSIDAPVKTIKHAKTLITAGCTILLKKGCVWQGEDDLGYEASGESGESGCVFSLLQSKYNLCKFDAYGDGELPAIDLSFYVHNVNWSKTAGFTNIYQYTLDISDVAYEQRELDDYRGLWEDETILEEVLNVDRDPGGSGVDNEIAANDAAALAYLDANAGTFYGANVVSNSITYYVHAADSSNPILNAKKYDIRKYRHAFFSGSNTTGLFFLKNILLTKTIAHGGPIVGNFYDIDNIIIEDHASHGILVNATTIRNSTIRKCNPAISGRGLFHAINFAGVNNKGVRLYNCDAYGYKNQGTGFFCHQSGVGIAFGNMVYENCRAYDCFNQFNFSDYRHILIKNCRSYRCNGPAIFDSGHVQDLTRQIDVVESKLRNFIQIEEGLIVNVLRSLFYVQTDSLFALFVNSASNAVINYEKSIIIFANVTTEKVVLGGVIGTDSSINFKECYLAVLGNAVSDNGSNFNFISSPVLSADSNATKITFEKCAVGPFKFGSGTFTSGFASTGAEINRQFNNLIGSENVFAVEKETKTVTMAAGVTNYGLIQFSGPFLKVPNNGDSQDYATVSYVRGDNAALTEFQDIGISGLMRPVPYVSPIQLPAGTINYENGTINLIIPAGTENDGEEITITAPVIRRLGQLDDLLGHPSMQLLIKVDSLASFLFDDLEGVPL